MAGPKGLLAWIGCWLKDENAVKHWTNGKVLDPWEALENHKIMKRIQLKAQNAPQQGEMHAKSCKISTVTVEYKRINMDTSELHKDEQAKASASTENVNVASIFEKGQASTQQKPGTQANSANL